MYNFLLHLVIRNFCDKKYEIYFYNSFAEVNRKWKFIRSRYIFKIEQNTLKIGCIEQYGSLLDLNKLPYREISARLYDDGQPHNNTIIIIIIEPS